MVEKNAAAEERKRLKKDKKLAKLEKNGCADTIDSEKQREEEFE